MCTLLYRNKGHDSVPGHTQSEESVEAMLRKLVPNKATNTASLTVEEPENHYLLLQVGPDGTRVGVQNDPKNLVGGCESN